MKKTLFFSIIILLALCAYPKGINGDSLQIQKKFNELENDLSRIERDQINYRIEKELLRETYSSNYERINMVITIVLGIIGILGYLGIKDINSIRKEYKQELDNLKLVQQQFNQKSGEFNQEKEKFENEIKQILLENEEQNRKIKLIELKEKINNLLKDNKLYDALEFINGALEISPTDITTLTNKAIAYSRLNNLERALGVYEEILELAPEDETAVTNTVECMFFANRIEEAEKMIDENASLFSRKSEGMLLKLCNLFRLYHKEDKSELIRETKDLIDFKDLKSMSKRMDGWNLEEAKWVAFHQKDSDLKTIIQNAVWYLDGQINGETLCKKAEIKIEET